MGDEAFAVLLEDDIIVDDVPYTYQLCKAHESLDSSVLTVQRVSTGHLSQYGMVVGHEVEPGMIRVENIKEKPP